MKIISQWNKTKRKIWQICSRLTAIEWLTKEPSETVVNQFVVVRDVLDYGGQTTHTALDSLKRKRQTLHLDFFPFKLT